MRVLPPHDAFQVLMIRQEWTNLRPLYSLRADDLTSGSDLHAPSIMYFTVFGGL